MRFKRGQMTSWKPLTITYNGFSLYPRGAASNVAATVLTRESIQEFRTQPDLQQKLRVSFLRMTLYGFETRFGKQITVTRAPNFVAKATGWLSPVNRSITIIGGSRES
jgi:hypothetical protein